MENIKYMNKGFTLLKLITYTMMLLLLILCVGIFPFIFDLPNYIILVILVGFLLSFIGEKQKQALNEYQFIRESDIILKYVTDPNYREKYSVKEKSILRKICLNICIFIFIPIDFILDVFINVSKILFPLN